LAARLAARPNDEGTKRKLGETEGEMDGAAAQLWGIADAELNEIHAALEQLR